LEESEDVKMEYFHTNHVVDIHDVDYNGVARTSALMRYIQSAAQTQLTESGMSYDQLKSKKRAFLLSRIRMEFTQTVRAYEPLCAVSFPCNSRGYSFLRCYELIRDGVTIGRAASVWALIDTDTHALIKVNDFDLGLKTFEPLDFALTRITMPENIEKVGTYFVSYADTDQNRHMNNTRYPDLYSNFLPLSNKRIESITINFTNEAPMLETLDVYRAEKNGYFYFRTIRPDGKLNTEAEIKLTDI
jgi:acyl-CoA thioesterase FadM